MSNIIVSVNNTDIFLTTAQLDRLVGSSVRLALQRANQTFNSKEELQQVQGIGPARSKAIWDLVVQLHDQQQNETRIVDTPDLAEKPDLGRLLMLWLKVTCRPERREVFELLLDNLNVRQPDGPGITRVFFPQEFYREHHEACYRMLHIIAARARKKGRAAVFQPDHLEIRRS